MRVVMVVGRSTGGIGVHVGQLSEELRRLGHEVKVVTDPRTADRFGWADALRWWPAAGGAVRWWPAAGGAVRWVPRMRRLLAGADVVHAHGLQAGALVTLSLGPLGPLRQLRSLPWSRSLSAAGHRPRFVVSLHNAVPWHGARAPCGGAHGAGAKAGAAVALRVVRAADLVTGASSDLVARAEQLGARAAELAPVPSPRVVSLLTQDVPNPVERSALAVTLLGRDVLHLPLVVTISRIAPQKSLRVLVTAAGELQTPVVWAVIGDGDPALLADLEQTAAGTCVRFIGARTDIDSWLRAATVFVLPSAWEARALVVQEAMAAGTPVVATDVGGLPDLLAGAGALVPAASPAALAAAVDGLLGDAERRAELSRRGRARARSWADGEGTARQWVSWYARAGELT